MNEAELKEISDRRQLLLDALEYQAEWRDQKAIEYPHDERNKNSAEALRQLAEQLEKIPPSDDVWRVYSLAWDRFDNSAAERVLEHERETLRTYGFGHSPSQVSAEGAVKFLRDHVEMCLGQLSGWVSHTPPGRVN
jgi:hypothetical protein